MHRSVLRVVVLALALSVGVATATAGGGNSANAKLCQKNGWTGWVRSDGSAFNNETECVCNGCEGRHVDAEADLRCGPRELLRGRGRVAADRVCGWHDRHRRRPRRWRFGPVGGFTGNSLYSGGLVKSFRLTFTKGVSGSLCKQGLI